MREYLKFYIDGQWVEPTELKTLDVINPATEAVCGKIALGGAADVDKAVMAARKAFASWSQTSREERLDVLNRILAEYQKRFGDLATAVTEEMGAPASLAQRAQVPIGMGHLGTAVAVLKDFKFEEDRGPTRIVKEPIGVCSFIGLSCQCQWQQWQWPRPPAGRPPGEPGPARCTRRARHGGGAGHPPEGVSAGRCRRAPGSWTGGAPAAV